jgi:O-antigen ligase
LWIGVVTLHGLVTVMQFLAPDFFRMMQTLVTSYGELDLYRPSGLFKNANAASFFQLMGFVPLLLLRPQKPVAFGLGVFLCLSIVATGSLGATAAFFLALGISVAAISVAGGFRKMIQTLAVLAVTATFVGGLFAFAIYPDYIERLRYTYLDRAQGSAQGRFYLWERGLAILTRQAPLWGIGPDAFPEVDIRGTYLHNDLLAFLVERGLLGASGLVLLGGTAALKAWQMLKLFQRNPDQVGAAGLIFLAALGGIALYSQTHQIFHDRSLWLVLAFQEVILARYRKPSGRSSPRRNSLTPVKPGSPGGLDLRPPVSVPAVVQDTGPDDGSSRFDGIQVQSQMRGDTNTESRPAVSSF